MSDLTSGSANQYQVEVGREKIIVYNYNGLSEWQHLNGLNLNEGNATLYNNTYNDMWSNKGGSVYSSQGGKSISRKDSKKDKDAFIRYQGQNGENKEIDSASHNYLFRDSYNVSHSDTILDMAILEVD